MLPGLVALVPPDAAVHGRVLVLGSDVRRDLEPSAALDEGLAVVALVARALLEQASIGIRGALVGSSPASGRHFEQHLRRHRGPAPAGVHRHELAVHRRQQRIDNSAQLAHGVSRWHSLFETDVTEHRPLKVLAASHRPLRPRAGLASDRSSHRACRRGIFQRPVRA